MGATVLIASFKAGSANLFSGALLILVSAGCAVFHSAAHAQQIKQEVSVDIPPELRDGGPLNVPVYPNFRLDEQPFEIEALKDSYIVLDDGSVLSIADWLLGSLNKSELGIGMSDYQNRLFLGQVARAAVGLNQDMIYRSFTDAGPARPYIPHTPSAPLQAAQGFLSYFIPALRPGWSPEIPEPKLSDVANRENGGAILFDRQFSEALLLSTEDFIYRGRLTNMLEEFQSKNEAKP